MASIRTAGLTKDFGDLRAVNEIDLDLPEGGAAGLMERMGHTSPAVALRYQHVMAGRDQAIAAALDELVQAAAILPAERAAEPPSGTLVARTRRAKPEGPGRRAAHGG